MQPGQRLSAILLNGPLGIGKSTLGEALGEAIERSVTLDGDQLSALNPPAPDEFASLHETIALLVRHHMSRQYDHFIINHYWPTREDITDLDRRLKDLATGFEVRCFRLTLPREENLRRIALRQSRAIDETAFEKAAFASEYSVLSAASGSELGEPFEVNEPPDVLVGRMLALLNLTAANF